MREDEYNETNKRHTMPHPPDHIPDLETTPTNKPLKEKKDKDKVLFLILHCIGVIYIFSSWKMYKGLNKG